MRTALPAIRASELRAERLHVRHPGVDFDSLRDVSIEVQNGEILALLGPNGSGKSTLLRTLGRELVARAGVVHLGETDIRRLPRRRLARRMARLPQEPISPEGLTVQELVEYGRHPHLGVLAPRTAQDSDVVSDVLQAVELGDLRHRTLETLSGGERRRAWIAMALAQEPEFLLLDEPTSALDLRHQFELLDLLVRLNEQRKTTIVLSLHDLEQAARIGHRVALLCRGRLYDVGPPREVLTEETLLDVFRVQSKITASDTGLAIQILGPGDPVRSF
jgi:iron complex transport system ATP-binding protein